MGAFEHDIFHGEAPERWPLGSGPLARDIDFGPGQLIVLGGAPGAGKTAFAMGAVFDALRVTPELRALVVNVEMSPSALLNRLLARHSGISLDCIQNRGVHKLADLGRARIVQGLSVLRECAPRLAFLEPPYTLGHAAEAADEFGARCLVMDYLQRIAPPSDRESQREKLEESMALVRRMTQAGAGVLVCSAVARQKNNGGSSYDGLGMASFRGSSELEFAADSCYALAPDKKNQDPDIVRLSCLKRRNGEPRDILLRFERAYQRFNHEEDPSPAGAITQWEGVYDDDEAPF